MTRRAGAPENRQSRRALYVVRSKLPRDLCVGATYGLTGLHASKNIFKLQAVISEEILADQADQHSRTWLPGETCIQPRVRGDCLIRRGPLVAEVIHKI